MRGFISTLVSTFLLLVTATPTGTASITPRDDSLLCLFMTSGPDWTGEGLNLCGKAGQCSSPLPDGLTGNVSSAGPSSSHVACFLFVQEGCIGQRSGALSYPGYADLTSIGFDNAAKSWICWNLCGRADPSIFTTTTVTVENQPTLTSKTNAVKITTTESVTTSLTQKRAEASESKVSITTTLTGTRPLVTAGPSTTSTSISSLKPSITTTASPTSPLRPLPDTPTPFDSSNTTVAITPTSSDERVSITTTLQTTSTSPLAVSMFTSTFILTHTYADGNTTVLTQTMVEPGVPTA